MATLEKIRSKSVLLLVIIGAALIAFILGDFLTSGRSLFGTGTTIAKVGSQKIDIREFQDRLEAASHQAQQSGRKVDNAVLQQQVLDGLVAEALYKQEISDLGLEVTDAELSNAMVGAGSAYLDQMVRAQMGVQSAAELHDMAYNPSKYGISEQQAQQLRAYWLDLEKQVEETLLQQKFQNLFTGTLVANQLDAKALYDDNNAVANIVFAQKPFASVADTDVEAPTDAELQARYDKERERYAIAEPMRLVSYVDVPIVPSVEDRQAAQAKVDAALAALAAQPETMGLADMPDFIVNRQKASLATVSDQRIKNFLQTSGDSAVKVVSNLADTYTIAKMISRGSDVDSVNIDILQLQGTKAERDSVIKGLNDGTIKFADLNDGTKAQGQQNMWLSLVDPQAAQIKETILNAPAATYFTPDTAAVASVGRIFRVNERKAPVTVYDYAVVTYTVDPSGATVNKLLSGLNKFLADNKTAADFSANAEKAGYTAQKANITSSTPMMGNVADSRGAVSWAMDAKKGQVSGVLGGEDSGHFMAVAVDDIYSGSYAPATDPSIRDILKAEVMADKKASKLIDQYKGKAKDVAGYAALMGTTPDTTSVAFGQYMIPKIGMGESAVAARASVAKVGELVGPMQGNSGVVVFQVTGVDNQGRPFSFDENSATFLRSRGAYVLSQRITDILRGRQKVTNNILKFYNDNH
ncbi:MAG: SurA N-terminal domain-containing protein [Candidatus Amulumruptor caecigallinarius]|nr:SurA N-terminal domain-containing protein [Candidatus Amulumruptor caecigallinarius]MCM1397097.1 SurA N-terminal domain-containing protein [Candidatus Amulumruptor caecigallinarius]MCM1454083.1 SurA N-terminal domain-containing protein [bacterium]